MKGVELNNHHIQETLDRLKATPAPIWLNAYLDNFKNNPDLPYFLLNQDEAFIGEDRFDQRFTQRKELLINRIAFAVRTRIVQSWWFELLIVITIIATSVIVGIELDTNQETFLQSSICSLSMGIFTLEFLVKVIAEGDQPRRYFTNSQCAFNIIDFAVLASWYILVGKSLLDIDQTYDFIVFRFFRVIRILTLIEHIGPLRLILHGMIDGLKSSFYILSLLSLVLFIGATIAVQFFGNNDPANFGRMGIAIVSLFQVSTTTSWSSLAYVSLYGCDNYMASGYDGIVDQIEEKETLWGTFELWDCTRPNSHHGFTPLFYVGFIIVAFATMSLFIASICASMFIAVTNSAIDIWRFEMKPKKELTALFSPNSEFNNVLERVFSMHQQAAKTTHGSSCGFAECCKVFEESRLYQIVIICLVFISSVGIGLSVTVTNDKYTAWLYKMHLGAFLIFLFEVIIKIGSYSLKNNSYLDACEFYLLHDKWNLLDTLIVAFALIEMLPLFDFIPVKGLMVFRFVHFLRLLHCHHFLSRLRTLVDSFGIAIHTAFWLIVVALIFNYVMACVGMILFRKNDPFHFGKLTSAFFTIWRIETGDHWDEILRINMYGCEIFPLGYPYLNNNKFSCEHDNGYGYFAFIYMAFTVIVGGYILPSVLIGVIGVHLQASFQRYQQEALMDSVQTGLIDDIQSSHDGWWDKDRLMLIENAFQLICHNEANVISLDVANDVFTHIIVRFIFKKNLLPKLRENTSNLNKNNVSKSNLNKNDYFVNDDDDGDVQSDVNNMPNVRMNESRNSLEIEMVQLRNSFLEGKKIDLNHGLKSMKSKVKDLLVLLDVYGDRLISVSEFISFIIMTKQLQIQLEEDGVDPTAIQIKPPPASQDSTLSRPCSEPSMSLGKRKKSLSKKNSLTKNNNNSSSLNSITASSSSSSSMKQKSPKRGGSFKKKKSDQKGLKKEPSFKSTGNNEETMKDTQVPTPVEDSIKAQIQRNIEQRKAEAREKEQEKLVNEQQSEVDEVHIAYVSVWEALLKQIETEDTSLWKKSLEKMFKSFDKNNNGDIDFNELGAGIKSLGIQLTPLQLNAFRECIDNAKDGRVSINEFTEAALKVADEIAQKYFKPNKTDAVIAVQKDPLKAAEEAQTLARAASLAEFVAAEALLTAQSAQDPENGDSGQNYHRKESVFDEAWAVILKAFNADDPVQWKQSVELLFDSFDRDGSGDIDIHKLGAGIKILGYQMTADQLSVFRDEIDLDRNGKISLGEFITGAQTAMRKQKKGNFDPVAAREVAVKQLQRANSIKDNAIKAQLAAEEATRLEQLEEGEAAKHKNTKKQSEEEEKKVLQEENKPEKSDKLLKDKKTTTNHAEAVKQTSVEEDRDPEDIWKLILKSYYREAQSNDLWQKKLEKVFKAWSKTDEVDVVKLGVGLKKIGVDMTPSELESFTESLDEDDDGAISLSEFMTAARWEMKKKLKEAKRKNSFISSPRTPTSPSSGKKQSYLKRNSAKQSPKPPSVPQSPISSLPKDFPLEQGSAL